VYACYISYNANQLWDAPPSRKQDYISINDDTRYSPLYHTEQPNIYLNSPPPYPQRNFLTSLGSVNFSGRALFHGVSYTCNVHYFLRVKRVQNNIRVTKSLLYICNSFCFNGFLPQLIRKRTFTGHYFNCMGYTASSDIK
jgi:hypothetical protein